MNKKQFTNKNMINMLDRIKSTEILEEMLKNYENQYIQFEGHGSKELDEILCKEPKELLKVVKKDVDEFLNMDGVSTPFICDYSKLKDYMGTLISGLITTIPVTTSIILGQRALCGDELLNNYYQYIAAPIVLSAVMAMPRIFSNKLNYSIYHPLLRVISFDSDNENDNIATIAHEYTHHIQISDQGMHRGYDAFREGHAMGVEKAITKKYSEKHDYHILQRSTNSRYAGNLRKIINALKKEEGTISPHTAGAAIFSIYEHEFGDSIYKDVLKDDFEWPKSTYIKG